MKVIGIIVNIFFPGIGTLIVGKIGQGIAQLLLFILGVILNFTVILSITVYLCVLVYGFGDLLVLLHPIQQMTDSENKFI